MSTTAATFTSELLALRSDAEREKYRRYFPDATDFAGVRMGAVFALARAHVLMPPDEIERLMEADIHEVRAGAMSIMARQYALKKTTPERRQALYDLYLRRHDRINDWDLVDLAAYHVIGPHLVDRPRDILYRLAASPNRWERRTAVLATFAFIRRGDLEDLYALAQRLIGDPEDTIHKAVGWMLRAADKDRPRLTGFLERHAARMPRIMLRNAIEHFAPEERKRLLAIR